MIIGFILSSTRTILCDSQHTSATSEMIRESLGTDMQGRLIGKRYFMHRVLHAYRGVQASACRPT